MERKIYHKNIKCGVITPYSAPVNVDTEKFSGDIKSAVGVAMAVRSCAITVSNGSSQPSLHSMCASRNVMIGACHNEQLDKKISFNFERKQIETNLGVSYCNQFGSNDAIPFVCSDQFHVAWHLCDGVIQLLAQFFVITAIVEQDNLSEQLPWRLITNTPYRSQQRRPILIVDYENDRCLWQLWRIFDGEASA